ncbi:MAG: hypothetical protein OEY56_11480 [Cyclobacteriaceae bacterium]|nr:hypothetical protein [Cyclobacteriaceae bacterium]
MKNIITLVIIGGLLQACSGHKPESKGFQVREVSEDEKGQKVVGLPIDSLEFDTRPGKVLLTKKAEHRLIPVYKIKYDPHTGKPFSGTTYYHVQWENDPQPGNNWNHNFMPGLAAVYGYNLVNVSHFDHTKKSRNEFFERPVLINTLYFPAFSNDTLHYRPVMRDYYMVSVYDEDSNQDGFLNRKDLRRLYLFDLDGNRIRPLVPTDYSVMSSEYDPDNDYMYVFARKDQNGNGQMEQEEQIHVFWIDLKNPQNSGVQYEPE